MSLQSIQERLTALQDTTREIEELIQRLATLKFQPGSIPLDEDGEGDVSAELGREIHQTLKEQLEDLQILEQEAQDVPPGRYGSDQQHDKAELARRLVRAGEELKAARRAFRDAQLTARRNLEEAQCLERQLLISSLTSPASSTDSLPIPRRKNLSSSAPQSRDEKIVDATGDVTAALRRTHMLMQSELSRSQFAHDTLKESTAALSQLSEQYSTLDTLLSSSRNLLSTLLRSQKSDTWYLETAFYVLVATIVWLVFRRFLYGPMWWFVWLPLKMFYKAWMGVFTAVGLRSSRDGVFASSSVGTTVLPESVLATPSISYSSPMATTSDPPPAHGEGSLLEEVGNMVDASRQQGEEGGPEQNPAPAEPEQPPRDPPPNPKKRMWEEPPPPPKAEAERKDEL